VSAPLGVGVIGLGFMGRTHVAAYRAADAAGHANRLVAVADPDEARRRGEVASAGNFDTGAGGERLFDPAGVTGYAEADELLRDPRVELVSICTPTDSHVPLALAALAAGKHVLVEKPVALAAADVERLAAAAAAADTLCMPAMCIRFWPAWSWLRDAVASGRYGAVRSAVFRRLGTRPGWNEAFYADASRSGGVLFDLHVHDADFVRWCFGAPDAVTAIGWPLHLTTTFRYDGGPPHVTAEGGWDHADGFPFHMGYTVAFERATADYALGREPELRLSRDGASEPVELEDLSGYDGEVRHLLDAIARGADRSELDATLDEALELTRMLERCRDQIAST
jgi:predicted dehydrogenase